MELCLFLAGQFFKIDVIWFIYYFSNEYIPYMLYDILNLIVLVAFLSVIVFSADVWRKIE